MTDKDGYAALHHSTRNGNYKLVTFSVDMGTDNNFEENLSCNFLHFGAFYGHVNLCKIHADTYNFDELLLIIADAQHSIILHAVVVISF